MSELATRQTDREVDHGEEGEEGEEKKGDEEEEGGGSNILHERFVLLGGIRHVGVLVTSSEDGAFL